MKLDTEFFGFLAQHSEKALIQMSLEMGEQRNIEALRQLLPIFSTKENLLERWRAIFPAFEDALSPPPDTGPTTWTPEQSALFQDFLPFLRSQDGAGMIFLKTMVQTCRDPAVLQALESGKTDEHKGLLTAAAQACNPVMLTGLIERTPAPVLAAWLALCQGNKKSSITRSEGSAIAAAWNNQETRPVLDRLLNTVPIELNVATRLEIFALALANNALVEPEEVSFDDNDPSIEQKPHEDRLKPEQFAAIFGTNDLQTTMQAVHAHALAYAQVTLGGDFKDHLRDGYQSGPITRLTAFALKTHCQPLLEALSPVFKTYSCDVDVYGFVMGSELKDPQAFKDTVAFLQTLGYPLQFGQAIFAVHEPDCALGRLAKYTELPDWKTKLAILLDLGADPDATDKRGKKPVDHAAPRGTRKAWGNVVISHAARHCAMNAIDEILVEISGVPAP